MSLRYCCDWCDKQLPVTITGEDTADKKITATLHFPRKVNVREFFPHLCESCARNIDIIIGLSQEQALIGGRVGSIYAELNRERREKLGTKG
jgi:hypothetical protein